MTVAALPLLVALALGQTGTEPYRRSRVDTGIANDPRAHCLWWGDPHVTFQQNQAGNPDVPDGRVPNEFDAFAAALDTWQAAANACSSLTLSEGPRVADREIGWVEGGPNENLIVYRMQFCGNPGNGGEPLVPASDPCWQDQTCQNKYDCFDQARATIAITTTTYDRRTGQIFDADVEGNGAFFLFTTVDSPPCPMGGPFTEQCVATDVQNTFTHELGHAFGLDHTDEEGSTMFRSAPAGETSKRVLDSGTRQFLCDVYPKNAPPKDCVISVAQSELGEAAGGCGCSEAGAPPLLIGLALWVLRGRRSRTGLRG
ncbi:MAG: matrixin [Myxococcaceae bacterium]|nr:matrixin [Myxococcaceae bacterium]